MKVIIDCNVWISFLLGFQKDLMRNVLTDEHIDVYVCPQLLYEIRDVAARTKIRSRVDEEDVEKLFELIHAYCINSKISKSSNFPIRDGKDLYLLSFAESLEADFIISGDKDLLDLGMCKNSRILSPSQFLSYLNALVS